MIILCIDSVSQGEEDYDFNDYTSKEKKTFIEQLTQQQLLKLQVFFATMPALEHIIDYNCKHCGIVDIIPIRGLQNFFS